ncbi:hypothetical protein AB205_0164580 [Aquarana catesbeiana]|uniref:Prolyl 4-hydroxylase alpha subunit domain-containing protein n=1 Tax=Aquarana catesbeiana TaxID=8400 RepID=A0A2G9P1W7_AQUCT|nr:hypothetical protein AB205_0164580 [Aquarana catesbeiana]
MLVGEESCCCLGPGAASSLSFERSQIRQWFDIPFMCSPVGSVLLDSVPFQHCVIRSFIENSAFLDGLKDELLALNFHDKSNDLYKFQQSEDLKSRKEPHISALRKVLFEDFRQWLSEVTLVELETTVDISCAQYNYTDTLLCHDDELEGRRFAFILYLVPEWTEADGGSLDLYSTDGNSCASLSFVRTCMASIRKILPLFTEKAQPGHIAKSLIPSWNTLVFFEVSPVSFHQHEILYEWINPVYLSVEYQAQVQEEFEDTSEILLKDFLKEEKFNAVSAALETQSVEWELLGPPNRRCYERAKGELPDVLKSCMELLKSEAFFLLLSNLTGLKLHFLAANNEESDEEEGSSELNGNTSAQGDDSDHTVQAGSGVRVPVCSGELRHWEHGHYTMIHDHDPERQEFALDLLWFCGCEDWEAQDGGFTSYIAKEEDEEASKTI